MPIKQKKDENKQQRNIAIPTVYTGKKKKIVFTSNKIL